VTVLVEVLTTETPPPRFATKATGRTGSTATPHGSDPTVTVAVTVPVLVLTTLTVPEEKFVT
jgi:hypothetical protein